MMDSARQILRSVFGYDRFISLQEQVIEQVLQKRDALAVMPTGGGKSLCYQIPALLADGPAIVVSPLISLMQDQVDQLRQFDIPTALLNSSLPDREYRRNVEQIRQGQAKLVYLAPETLLKPAILDLLAAARVSLLAIDEAHCISEWGPDFRPEYRRLAELRPTFPEAVCLALTATATPRVRRDIAASLELDEAAVLVAGFNRENLFIRVVEKHDPVRQAFEFIRHFPGESGIVYCSTRKQVDHLAALLRAESLSAAAYHAGMSDDERARTQSRFVRDEILIVVATVAFGMGIDKSNVRFVLHFDLPKSLESYYQEIGRAGRDGLRADCLLLFSYADTVTANYFINQMEDPQARRAASLQLNHMVGFAEAESCRRIPLLGYFGEEFSKEQCGDMCDNCVAGERIREDLTIPAQKFLSCVKRTGERFGAAHIIAVLRGSKRRRVLENGHDRLSTYGIGKEYTRQQWRRLANQFIHRGLLLQDPEYGGLSLTAKAWQVLRGKEPFFGRPPSGPETSAASRDSDSTQPAEIHRDLFEQLRSKRTELAQAGNVPPYVVFSDRTLTEMAARLPQAAEDLLRIHGVGTVKAAKYGAEFLGVIRDYCREHPEATPAESGPNPVSRTTSRGLPRRFHEVGEAFQAGRSMADLARDYEVKIGTIATHLERYGRAGNRLRADGLEEALSVSAALREQVLNLFEQLGTERLRPIFDALNEAVGYDQLKILRMLHIACRLLPDDATSGTECTPTSSTKTLVCLANSRKYSGRCVAGKEWMDGRIGRWIRPVSRAATGELTAADLLLADGTGPELLDLVTIPLKESCSRSYQSENHFLGPQRWVRTGSFPRDRIADLCDPVDRLWINGHHSYAGRNDRMPQNLVEKEISSSLLFLRVEQLAVHVRTNSKGLKKIWAGFQFCGTCYRLSVTDPRIEAHYLEKELGDYPIPRAESYVTVSISEPFQGFCYKLAAAILAAP